jgi:hypothetical protein
VKHLNRSLAFFVPLAVAESFTRCRTRQWHLAQGEVRQQAHDAEPFETNPQITQLVAALIWPRNARRIILLQPLGEVLDQLLVGKLAPLDFDQQRLGAVSVHQVRANGAELAASMVEVRDGNPSVSAEDLLQTLGVE